MKHSPAGMSASPPPPEIFLVCWISLGLLCNSSKKHLDMTPIDTSVLLGASTSKLLTLILYYIKYLNLPHLVLLPWYADPVILIWNCYHWNAYSLAAV